MGKFTDVLDKIVLSSLGRTSDKIAKNTSTAKLNPKEISVSRSAYYNDSQHNPYNPAKLYQRKSSYELYDKIRGDEVVDSLMEYKKNLVLGSSFYVDSPDDKVREFWEKNLYREYEGNFIRSMFEILTAFEYGFSLSEIIHKPIILNGKTYWGIKEIKTRPPHTFELDTDNYGNLNQIIQHSASGEPITLDPDNFLLYVHRGEFGNPYGKSDFNEGVYRATFSKEIIIKFMNIALERFSMPLVVGTHPEQDDPEDIQTLYDALHNLSAKSTLTKSDKYGVEFLESKRNLTDTFIQALEFYNLSMARSFLISDLMGMSGKQMAGGGLGGGLGDVQFEVMMEILNRYRYLLCELMDNKVILPLTKLNFGNNAEAYLRINDLTKGEKYKAITKFFEYLKTPGSTATDEQRLWAMEIIGAPVGEQEEQEDEDEKEKNKTPDEKEPDIVPDDKNILIPEPEDKKDKPVDDDKKVQDKKAAMASEFKPSRELTKPEEKINFVELDNKIEAAITKYTNQLSDGVKKILNKVYDTINNKKLIEKKRFDQIDNLSITGKGVLNTVFSNLLDEMLGMGKTDVEQEEANIKKLAAFNPEIDLATAEVIKNWKRSKIVYLTKTIERDIRQVLEPQLTEAMRTGTTLKETIREIDKSLSTKLSPHRLEMIVRTNTMSAYNQGRAQQFKKVPDMRGVQWSAILDDMTCPVCDSFDGKILRMSEIDDYPLPAHPNCRCLQVSVHSDDVEGQSDKEIYKPLPSVQKKDGFMTLTKEA